MAKKAAGEAWTAETRIISEGRLVLEREGSRLIAELTYAGGNPNFLIQLKFSSAARKLNACHLFPLESMPGLLIHVAKLLEETIRRDGRKTGPQHCRLK